MRLQVNLIPAIAYALVTMFSHMAGLKTDVEQTAVKKQTVCLPVRHQEQTPEAAYIWAVRNGQLILSSGLANTGLVWKIPYTPSVQI